MNKSVSIRNFGDVRSVRVRWEQSAPSVSWGIRERFLIWFISHFWYFVCRVHFFFWPIYLNTFPLWNDYARLANVWGCYTMGGELPFPRLNGWLECPHAGHGIRNSSSLTSLPVLFWEQRKVHTVVTLQPYLPTIINGIKLEFILISPSMSTRENPRGLNSKRPILCWVQGELGEKGAPCNPWIHRAQKMVKSEAEFYSGDSPTLMIIETSAGVGVLSQPLG